MLGPFLLDVLMPRDCTAAIPRYSRNAPVTGSRPMDALKTAQARNKQWDDEDHQWNSWGAK